MSWKNVAERLVDDRERARIAGQWLQARVKRIDNRCAVCDAPFIGPTRQRYCSQRCNVRAFRQRQREKAT